MKNNINAYLRTVSLLYKGLTLFLMFSVSLVACAENEQEIGVPVIENYITPHLTTFAPKGERMYVLSQGKLTHYSLSPLEIISSIKVDFNIPPRKVSANDLKDPKYKIPSGARLFITTDERKLIVYTYKKIILFDIDKRKTVKTISLGTLNNRGVLNGDEFVVLDDENKVTIFDAHSLKQIRKFTSLYSWTHKFSWPPSVYHESEEEKVVGFNSYRNSLNKIGGYIFLYKANMPYSSEELMIFDAKTYDIVFSFKAATLTKAAISYDLKTIFLDVVSSIYDNSNQDRLFPKTRKVAQSAYGNKYNLVTKDITPLTAQEGKQYSKTAITLNREIEFKVVGEKAYTKWYAAYFSYKGTRSSKRFLQFLDGEAILERPKTKNFQITSAARKYLKMKNSKGEVVSMNDVTFNNFNKAGISPMEW